MKRLQRLIALTGLCAVFGSGGISSLAADSPKAASVREIPKAWRLAEIEDASPPRSDDGPTYVLAWKIMEDNRPLRVEYCLVLKELKKPGEKQERWALASLVRNPAEGKEWNIVTLWITPNPTGATTTPPFIMHLQKYQNRPGNDDLHKFMDKFDWKLGADRDWKLIDGGICEAWEKVIGEKPARSFQP